jgi:hypothetical protein
MSTIHNMTVTLTNRVSNRELGLPIEPKCYAYDPERPPVVTRTGQIMRSCIIVAGKVTGERKKIIDSLER